MRKEKRFQLAVALGFVLATVVSVQSGSEGLTASFGTIAEANCAKDCQGPCRRTKVNVRKCCKKAWAICTGDCRDNVPYVDNACVGSCNAGVQKCQAAANAAAQKAARDAAERQRIAAAQAAAAAKAKAAAAQANNLKGTAAQAKAEAQAKLNALRAAALSGDVASITAAANAVKAAAAKAKAASAQATTVCH